MIGELRTYGRTRGRPLKAGRAELLAARLPSLAVPAEPFDPLALAPRAQAVWLEAGFGAGEHLTAQAAARPEVLMLGAEPFVNGLAACVAEIEARRLSNVRLHAGDVRALMTRLPDASVDRLFLLFPDPWPKPRHWKRRLVSPSFLAESARVLKPGATVRFATDWAQYADWALERFLGCGAFDWTAERADDWRRPPADHAATRYERKRLGDCAPVWLDFTRARCDQAESPDR